MWPPFNPGKVPGGSKWPFEVIWGQNWSNFLTFCQNLRVKQESLNFPFHNDDSFYKMFSWDIVPIKKLYIKTLLMVILNTYFIDIAIMKSFINSNYIFYLSLLTFVVLLEVLGYWLINLNLNKNFSDFFFCWNLCCTSFMAQNDVNCIHFSGFVAQKQRGTVDSHFGIFLCQWRI